MQRENQTTEFKESWRDDYLKWLFSTLVTTDKTTTAQKTTQKTAQKTRDKILQLLREKPEIATVEVVEITGLTLAGVNWNIRKLKGDGKLRRVGARRGGHWEVIE